MGRRKVKLAYIENDTSRRVSYKKRMKSLLKKTQELSVLCGVDACAVLYGPYSQAPVVWPSSEEELLRIISDFKGKPEVDQSSRRFDQESYLEDSMKKATERLQKIQLKNREMEMENLITDIMTGKLTLEQVLPTDLGDMLWVLKDKLRLIKHRFTAPATLANPSANDGGNPSVVTNQAIGFDMMQELSVVVNQTLPKQMEQLGSSSKTQP